MAFKEMVISEDADQRRTRLPVILEAIATVEERAARKAFEEADMEEWEAWMAYMNAFFKASTFLRGVSFWELKYTSAASKEKIEKLRAACKEKQEKTSAAFEKLMNSAVQSICNPCKVDAIDSALEHPGHNETNRKDILLGCGTGVVRKVPEQRVEDAINANDLIPHGSSEKGIDVEGNRIRSLNPHLLRLRRLYPISVVPRVSSRDNFHDMDVYLSPSSPRFTDVNTRSTPHLKQCIHDALEPLLGAVTAVVQSHGQQRRKQREEFLDLEEKKLALRRKEIQRLERRRAGGFKPYRRAFLAKSSRPRTGYGHRVKFPRTQ